MKCEHPADRSSCITSESALYSPWRWRMTKPKEVIDFLADVPWKNWKTDAGVAEMLSIENWLRQPQGELREKFEFRIWTESADAFAYVLWIIMISRTNVLIERGALGGGEFLVRVEPVNGYIEEIQEGKPIKFLLTLTGPPTLHKAIDRMCGGGQ